MKKAVVFFADGVEECEGLLVVDILRRAGVDVTMASVMDRLSIISSRHIIIQTDELDRNIDFSDVDLIVLPGGRLGTENLAKSGIVAEQCSRFAEDKMLAAVCAAPSLLASLGLLEGKRATCHPDYESKMRGAVVTGESVTVDGNIITGQGLGATIPFALRLADTLAGRDKAELIATAICYRV